MSFELLPISTPRRLDIGEIALKGGESGKPAIKPDDAFQSNLIRLVLLPKDHDDVMPPTGKEPFTTQEVVTLINWIQEGAPFADFGVAPKTEKSEPAPRSSASAVRRRCNGSVSQVSTRGARPAGCERPGLA